MQLSSRLLRLTLFAFLSTLPRIAAAQAKAQFTLPQVTTTNGSVASLIPGNFQPTQSSGLTDLLYVNAFTSTGTTFSVNAGELLNHQGFTDLFENQINFTNVLGAAAAVADFDGDNIPDYAFALSPIKPGATNLCIYFGTGAAYNSQLSSYSGDSGVYLKPPASGRSGCTAFPTTGAALPSFTYIAAIPARKGSLPQLLVEDSRNNILYILANTGQPAANGVLSSVTVKGQIPIPPADGAGPITVFDLDGDGNTDFIVNNQAGNAATVYFGNGDGTFQQPQRYTFSHNVHSLLLRPADTDGRPALIVEADNGIIEIHHFDTNNTFTQASEGGTSAGLDGFSGNGGHLAAIGDVNGDGIPDILTTTPIGLSVLLGQGSNRYQLKGIYNIGPGRTSFALADFDGDGNLDLAVDSPEGVAIVHGNGDGSFRTSAAYPVGQPALNATVGDFNADQKFDMIVATGALQAQVMLGNGDGTFSKLAAPTNPTVPNPYAATFPNLWSNVLTGDFDGDGCTDLLFSLTGLPLPTPGPSSGSGLYLQYGNKSFGKCDATFAAPVPISPQAVGAQSLTNFFGESAIADLNGDGIADIVNIDTDFYNTLLSQTTGPFKLSLNFAEDNPSADTDDLDSFSQVASGFFTTGRGNMQDLVFQDDANITPYRNNRDGTFTALPNLSQPPPVSSLYGGTIILADLDGDGHGDIIIPYHFLGSNPANPTPGAANQLYVWYGNGDGTFQQPQITTLTRNFYLAQVVDMNGDGLPDLVLSDGYLVAILYNQGNKTFGGEQHFLAGQGINSLSLADINGDGALDLIVANGGATISNAVALGGIGNSVASIALTPNSDVNTGGLTVLLNNIKTKAVTGTLTATPEPGKYQAAFTITAALAPTPGVAPPTGTVDFSLNGVPLGTSPVVPGATASSATYTVPSGNTYQGTLSLSATYNGDAFNSPLPLFGTHAIQGSATTASVLLCVGPTPACPSTGVVVPPFTAFLTMYYGQTFNGTFQASANDGSVLTGNLSLDDGATPICTLPVGIASACPAAVGTTVGTSVGTHVFTAVYAGDTTHAGTTSPPVTLTVLQDTNAATLIGSPNPSPQGQPVAFTATFTGNDAPPVGTVTFTETFPPTTLAQLLGTVNLVPGPGFTSTATFTTSTLPLGKDTITAAYAATTNFAFASATIIETITPVVATTSRLTSSLNPSVAGQSVTFTDTVSTSTGTPIPTGTVTFFDGTATLGTGTLTNGIATFTTSTLTAGTHTITATSSGDSATAPSSATLTQIVNPLPPPGSVNFRITVTPSPISVGVGNSTSVTVTVIPINGFAQPVTLSCSNLPTESACTFVTPTIPAGGGSTSLLLSTMAPHNCGSTQPYFIGRNSTPGQTSSALPIAAPMLAGLTIFLIPGRRRWLRALIATVAIATALQITGCGTCTDLGTRPAAYTLQIVGAASGTSEVESTPLTLNVTI